MGVDNLEEYLNKDFDYTKLTKQALRKIMYDNGVEDIPPLRSKKDEILNAYKKHIHSKIDDLRAQKIKDSKRVDNQYQRDRSSIMELDIDKKSKPNKIMKNVSVKNSLIIDSDDDSIKNSILSDQDPKQSFHESEIHNSFVSQRGDSSDVLQRPTLLRRHLSNSKELPDSEDESSQESDTDNYRAKSKQSPKKTSSANRKNVTSTEVKGDVFFDPSDNKNQEKKGRRKRGEPKDRDERDNKGRFTVSHVIKTFLIKGHVFFIAFSIIMLLYGYLKFFCHYCRADDEIFCIPPPRNSKIENGKIVCDTGYVLCKNPIKNFCKLDDSKEKLVKRTVKNIVRKLELKNGDFLYGMTKTSMIPLSEVTDDSNVIEELLKTPGININDDMIYSVNHQTSLQTFVSFYFKKTLFFLIPFVIIVLSYKYLLKRRKKIMEIRSEAKVISKDIHNVLMRQLLLSAKNKGLPSYVFLEQLKDVYGENAPVWCEVVSMIEGNSNIKVSQQDNRKVIEWIGPIINVSDIQSPIL